MKVLEKGNIKNNWNLECVCSGKGWQQTTKPCYSKMLLEDGDIYQRTYTDMYDCTKEIHYGFVCSECGCFTEILKTLLPIEVMQYARKYEEK